MAKGWNRRDFIKTFVVTAGAVVAAPLVDACGDDGPSGTPDAPGNPDARGNPDAPPLDSATAFPQSVVSGDPRTDSIILWTRFAGTADQELAIELSTSADFTSLVTVTPATVTAATAADGTVRVKVVGLTAATRYYYRFRAASAGVTTRTGRFKTAPTDATDAQVRFALLSCQDYVGKFYNTLTELLAAGQDDLDFVLFIGDYVYETTGDPQFQGGAASRAVTFSDTAGAIPLGTTATPFYAAKSLSNYRELYKTYRSDKTLQAVHEKFPFVIIWDDHEFSDDCWGDHGTYFDGLKGDEEDLPRRKNSEQAFFEYQPVALDSETGTGALSLTQDQLFPATKLYREFRFGKNVHLLMTDYRSFRPDHPIPEQGFPGKIVMDMAALQATLTAAGSATPPSAFAPYVNIDDPQHADQKTALMTNLTAAYVTAGADAAVAASFATDALKGNIDVNVANTFFTDAQVALKFPTTGQPFGMSLALMGKTGLFGQLGARYLVVKPTYDLYALYRSMHPTDTPDDPYGAVQSAWLDERLAETEATWTFLIDSVSMTSLIVDLEPFAPLPIPAVKYYLNCDQWDGFPVHRAALFAKLQPKNVVVLSGDIHAAYATDYGANPDTGNRMVEFTCPGVSSGPFAQLLDSTARSVPALADSPLVAQLIAAVDTLMKLAFDKLKYANSNVNGVVVLTATGTQLKADFALLDPAEVTTDSTGDAALAGRFTRVSGTVAKVDGKNGPITGLPHFVTA